MGRWLLDLTQGRRVTTALLALAGILAASALGSERGLLRVRALRAELVGSKADGFALVQEIERLRRQLDDVRSDDETLERLVRRRSRFVRSGETLYQLSPPGAAARHEQEQSVEQPGRRTISGRSGR